MDINQKGFANIALIIFLVILAGTVGFLALNQRSSIPTPTPSPTPSPTPVQIPPPTPTPSSGSISVPENNTALVSLGQQFTLKKGQVAKIADTDLEVEITEFYNSPCPTGTQCFWAGVGIAFEYRFNGRVQKGIDLVRAFGYQTTVVGTDHETYANLVVEKMK